MVQNALQANAATIVAEVTKAEVSDALVTDTRESHRPALRLAVVNDSPIIAEPPAAVVPEVVETILVIEDEAANDDRPQPGVRRENYRQLFSRLRHGT